ncbi:hypothetical protein PHO31112_03935 [Pandoraea horticolens]|uniref:Surface presentation of antigen domain-containing protein n=1 Tax=Pandoraea horticolens TaxID=2508298 RepID=A0A5E4XLC9_9BURK|nr:hypothetical protein [Pandoraea horticolens]VVE36922.1 hypothetical protein PHO31112_03935 [Pandoraea horticolens]
MQSNSISSAGALDAQAATEALQPSPAPLDERLVRSARQLTKDDDYDIDRTAKPTRGDEKKPKVNGPSQGLLWPFLHHIRDPQFGRGSGQAQTRTSTASQLTLLSREASSEQPAHKAGVGHAGSGQDGAQIAPGARTPPTHDGPRARAHSRADGELPTQVGAQPQTQFQVASALPSAMLAQARGRAASELAASIRQQARSLETETPGTTLHYSFSTWDGQPAVAVRIDTKLNAPVVMARPTHESVGVALERHADRLPSGMTVRIEHDRTGDDQQRGGQSRWADGQQEANE